MSRYSRGQSAIFYKLTLMREQKGRALVPRGNVQTGRTHVLTETGTIQAKKGRKLGSEPWVSQWTWWKDQSRCWSWCFYNNTQRAWESRGMVAGLKKRKADDRGRCGKRGRAFTQQEGTFSGRIWAQGCNVLMATSWRMRERGKWQDQPTCVHPECKWFKLINQTS